VGQVVHHLRFDYRGVVVDADATFQGSDEWYDQMARSRPPRDAPWYHVLVDGAEHSTYVAERHLEPDESGDPIDHPMLDAFFERFGGGRYHRTDALN
jgi:heat shock protein HspQ